MREFLLFETIFGETFFDFNNLSFCLHEKVHIMFCSHRVSLGIKSRCDVLFEFFLNLYAPILAFWAWSLTTGWDRRDFNFAHVSA